MNREERERKKLRVQQEKAQIRHHKKIEKGLDLCLIAACFLAFLAAAVVQGLREMKEKRR